MSDFWKPTSEMFSGLIERPKMTEKLLLKPPFKYLFDIIMETIKKTGCGNGLYTGQELNADFYADRDKKISYLQKTIKLIELMSGEAMEAKPQKIVAGLQPELTNLMLQKLYEISTSGKSSEPYVNKVLGKDTGQPEKKEIKKPERPPSAARLKKPEKPEKPEKPADNLKKPKEEEEEVPQEKPIAKQVEAPIQKVAPKQEENYSGKVRELMKEAEEEAVVQKQVEKEDTNAKKGINLGKLNKKKKGGADASEKIISSGGELTEKELELVQNMIQSICQNTAPLGKSVEFINDDVQAMNKELTAWRKQYNASKAKTQNEMKLTEEALMPIYDKIHEIEEQIFDQKAKIQTTKSQILKNDSTIRDLLMSVVTTK